ncbi:MAG TPA: RidA family protein [Fimbriimonadaceae bacterium]|nr:RidA family protein [Fimbriimonadaceae bacterium]
MPARRTASSGSPFETSIGFSRALRVGAFTSVSGTAPVDSDGTNAAVGDVIGQARRCFEIIQDALHQVGVPLQDVVRTRMYLVRASDGEAVGLVHGAFFGEIRPAATMVVVAGLLRPEWLVEVEADAYSPDLA